MFLAGLCPDLLRSASPNFLDGLGGAGEWIGKGHKYGGVHFIFLTTFYVKYQLYLQLRSGWF